MMYVPGHVRLAGLVRTPSGWRFEEALEVSYFYPDPHSLKKSEWEFDGAAESKEASFERLSNPPDLVVRAPTGSEERPRPFRVRFGHNVVHEVDMGREATHRVVGAGS
jgi:hypothetical protein